MAAETNAAAADGRSVNERRKELGLTNEELAARAGLDVRVVRGIAYGEVDTPSAAAVAALAKALEIPAEELARVLPDLQTADLSTVRRSRRLTVAQVAAAVGRSERHVFRVEAGELLPDDPLLWAEVYDLTKTQLAQCWRNCRPRPPRRAAPPPG